MNKQITINHENQMTEIPDAYKEAVKHIEVKPCDKETLQKWTSQKTKRISQQNLRDNVHCLFWNSNVQQARKDYLAD